MKELTEFKDCLKEITDKKLSSNTFQFILELANNPFIEFHYKLMKNENSPESLLIVKMTKKGTEL